MDITIWLQMANKARTLGDDQLADMIINHIITKYEVQ